MAPALFSNSLCPRARRVCIWAFPTRPVLTVHPAPTTTTRAIIPFRFKSLRTASLCPTISQTTPIMPVGLLSISTPTPPAHSPEATWTSRLLPWTAAATSTAVQTIRPRACCNPWTRTPIGSSKPNSTLIHRTTTPAPASCWPLPMAHSAGTTILRMGERAFYPDAGGSVIGVNGYVPWTNTTNYLRIQKTGTNYNGWYSADGTNWIYGGLRTDTNVYPWVGLFVIRYPWDGVMINSSAQFYYFHVTPLPISLGMQLQGTNAVFSW